MDVMDERNRLLFPESGKGCELDGRRVEIGPLPLLKNCSREVNERDRDVTTAIVLLVGCHSRFVIRFFLREGRIRSAERVEAHLVCSKSSRTFFQPTCG